MDTLSTLLTGKSVPMPHHSLGEELFPNTQPKQGADLEKSPKSVLTGYPSKFIFMSNMLNHPLDKSPLHCLSWYRSRMLISFSEFLSEETTVSKVLTVFFYGKSCLAFFNVARSSSLLHLKPICIYKINFFFDSFCQFIILRIGDEQWLTYDRTLELTCSLAGSLCDSAALVHPCTVNSTTHPQRAGHTWTRGCHSVNSPTIQLRTHSQRALCQTAESTETNSAAEIELENNYGMSFCKIL